MQKATFIIHGKLKSKKKLQNEISEVFSNCLTFNFLFTDINDGALKVTKDAITDGSEIIIICGGDGSINEMVNGYFTSSFDSNIVFGVLPYGTGNDFAKSLKVTTDLHKLKSNILNKSILEVDVFNMNFFNLKKKNDNRFFINISDIGIGGHVAENIATNKSFLSPNLKYFKAILASFFKYKKKKVSLTTDKFDWKGIAMSICMANGRYFGSGLCIAPDAKLNDENLQITLLGNVSIIDYLLNLGTVKKGNKIKHSEVFYKNAKNCKIESLEDTECPIDMDGEFIGFTPIEVNLHDKKMKFLCEN